MNNDLNNSRCKNPKRFHLDYGVENRPKIILINTMVDKLKGCNIS